MQKIKTRFYSLTKLKENSSTQTSANLLLRNAAKTNTHQSRWAQTADALAKRYETSLQRWTDLVHEKFIHEFYLREEQFKIYLKIREDFENEKTDLNGRIYYHYIDKKNNQRNKEIIFDQQIKLKYLKKIKRLIGNNNFKLFLNGLEEFNESQRGNAHDGTPQYLFDL